MDEHVRREIEAVANMIESLPGECDVCNETIARLRALLPAEETLEDLIEEFLSGDWVEGPQVDAIRAALARRRGEAK